MSIKYVLCDLGGVIVDVNHELYQKFIKDDRVLQSEIDHTVYIDDPDYNDVINGIIQSKFDRILKFADLNMTYLGVLSNTCSNHIPIIRQKLQDFGYGGFSVPFNQTFFSCYLKCRKPQPEIYEKVLHEIAREYSVLPYEILFIDDRLENCLAAEKFGMKYIYPDDNDLDYALSLFGRV